MTQSIVTTTYRIRGLDPAPFAAYFEMTDAQLALAGARRSVADSRPGFPCRVTLDDAQIGEEMLLVNFEHLAVETPYRSRHAIYISRSAIRPFDDANIVPPALARRTLAVRAFSSDGMMSDAEVTPGAALADVIARIFADDTVAYLHAHFAARGCFAARIDRG